MNNRCSGCGKYFYGIGDYYYSNRVKEWFHSKECFEIYEKNRDHMLINRFLQSKRSKKYLQVEIFD